jgi:hypothetical protein
MFCFQACEKIDPILSVQILFTFALLNFFKEALPYLLFDLHCLTIDWNFNFIPNA